MLSRETTRILAEVYANEFQTTTMVRTTYSRRSRKRVVSGVRLYDYLYEQGYEAWFLRRAKELNHRHPRALEEFIMQLHTGETVVAATPDWTWQQRRRLGQQLLRDLAEDILLKLASQSSSLIGPRQERSPELIAALELDGYLFRDGQLYYAEAAVLDVEEEGVLAKLIKDLELANQDVIEYHLALSVTHYINEKWHDSIANSRSFLESVLREVAAKHHLQEMSRPLSASRYSSPAQVRDYLRRQDLIAPKEEKALAAVYGLLSETGGHPYVAEKDQARLLRYLALTFAQFALLRLQNYLHRRFPCPES